jgi:hypothetical protein
VVGIGGTSAAGGSSGVATTGGTTAAQSSLGGSGGQLNPGGELRVLAAPPSPWCVGTEYNAVLTASGGGPTFTWTPGPSVPGLTLGTATSTSIPLTGKPTEAGTYPNVVTARDGTNTPGAFALVVNAVPSITTSSLTARCLGEKFEEQLVATAANATDLEWTAVLPSDLGITLSASGVLSGILKKTGEFNLEFSARNKTTGCVSTKKILALTVNGESSTNCPTIKVKGQPSVMPAPGGCEAWPYSAEFEVTGGISGPAWGALNKPPGLTFDPDTRILSGNPTASGTLTLQVTDTNKRVYLRDFEIPLRNKCWFGYVSDESGANRLHLFDPLLKTRLQRPVSNSPDLSVADFKFSPDGKFVAYRVKDASNNYALWLWQAPGWVAEKEIPFGGSVTHYEWSKNSGVLAVAIKTSDDTLLGGVDVTAVPAAATAGPIQGHRVLTSVSAPVDSELTWFGPTQSEYVAFHTLLKPGYSFRVAGNATLNASGFTDAKIITSFEYSAGLYILDGNDGFYVGDSTEELLVYNKLGSTSSAWHGNDAVSPSTTYTSVAVDAALKVFRATDDSVTTEEPAYAEASNCSSILSWTGLKETIVCVGSDLNSIWRHTLSESLPVPNFTSSKVVDNGEFLAVDWSGFKRLSSRRGEWLALANKTSLVLVDLAAAVPQVRWSAPLSDSSIATSMNFSPSDSLVVVQRGKNLLIFNVSDPFSLPNEIGSLRDDPENCQESWLSAGDWCGSAQVNRNVAWSPDSQLLAYVRETYGLVIQDLRYWLNVSQNTIIRVATNCDDACRRGMQFQP